MRAACGFPTARRPISSDDRPRLRASMRFRSQFSARLPAGPAAQGYAAPIFRPFPRRRSPKRHNPTSYSQSTWGKVLISIKKSIYDHMIPTYFIIYPPGMQRAMRENHPPESTPDLSYLKPPAKCRRLPLPAGHGIMTASGHYTFISRLYHSGTKAEIFLKLYLPLW